LIIIVLLSLMDSFISSAIFSVIAVGCLDFFFTEPLFTFAVARLQDVVTLAAFIVTSLAITGLVRRVRRSGEARGEQARLLDLTRDSILVRDTKDVITYWNRGSEELYGWKKEEAIGKISHQLLQTIFPAPLEQIMEILVRAARWEGELLHTTRDGTKVLVISRWSLEQGDGGQALGTLEINNDITERRRAEDALRQTQETYLAEAQQLSHTGSFGWNVSSGEIFWSGGRREHEALGRGGASTRASGRSSSRPAGH
jgi:PAS domain S-box-containing protein